MNKRNEKALAKTELKQIVKSIDAVVKDCLPVMEKDAEGFQEALTIAQGMKTLREIFQTSQPIKDAIMAMANTPLGFMTDRTPAAVAASQRASRKTLVPYNYNEIAECCIEAMLKGYRITNNEWNIIAGRFYPAKNGKYRKVNEMPGVSDFKFTTTPPLFDIEQRMTDGKMYPTQIAKVQCFASWKLNGVPYQIGQSVNKAEDKLVFKIRVNKGMGDDGIKGKAESKLFSKVLERLTGRIIPESTDVQEHAVIDILPEDSPAADLKKISDVQTDEPAADQKKAPGVQTDEPAADHVPVHEQEMTPDEIQDKIFECTMMNEDLWDVAEQEHGPIIDETSFIKTHDRFLELLKAAEPDSE